MGHRTFRNSGQEKGTKGQGNRLFDVAEDDKQVDGTCVASGTGHVYQGRFKSFPIQEDHHFLTICRYVERNALRANLVARAEQWRWGSL